MELSLTNYSLEATPGISVILPVYNGESYLLSSVESVLKQVYTDFEFLILDDCSTDNSWQYLNNLNDKRITLFKNENNKGLFYNLNFLIKKSRHNLIKIWAQDDIMYPNCLESFAEFFEQYPRIGFAYCGIHNIDEDGHIKQRDYTDTTPRIISTELHARIAFFTGSIAGNISNVCLNRAILEKVGLFNEQMKISGDFDMWVRLARNHSIGFIREKMICLRDHSGQLSRNEIYYINHVKEDLEVYRYLNSYLPAALRKSGRLVMRKNKLVFYYTLMMKAFFKGDIKTGIQYFKLLNAYDNIVFITMGFITVKIFKSKKISANYYLLKQ